MSKSLAWADSDVEIYVKPAGWSAEFSAVVNEPGMIVDISMAVMSVDNPGVSWAFEFQSAYGEEGFYFLFPDEPLEPETEYEVTGSYWDIENDTEQYGFSFKFSTTERGTETPPESDAPETPAIKDMNVNTFDGLISVTLVFDVSGCQSKTTDEKYSCGCWVKGLGLESQNLVRWDDGITASINFTIDDDKLQLGSSQFFVSTWVEWKGSLIEGSWVICILTLFGFSYRYSGNFKITAEEWNLYRNTLAERLNMSGEYEYNPVDIEAGTKMVFGRPLAGEASLNEPIDAYFNCKGTYYANVIPKSKMYFGDYSQDENKIRAGEFFDGLADMLNSLFYEHWLGEDDKSWFFYQLS